MSDHSSAALARVLCLDDPSEASDTLARILRIDPPLALWAVCRAKQTGVEPRDPAALAAWLLARLAEPKDWPDNTPTDEAPSRQFAEAVRASVARAEMASSLAAEDGEQAADRAYLAGLLHEPVVWTGLSDEADDDSASRFTALLPSWLADSTIDPRVAAAIERLGPDAGESASDDVLQRSHWLGAAAMDCWAQSDPLATVPLGRLVERFARLKTLETKFHETLEAEKLEAMAEFAAGAGHEINNPLAVIAGRAQLLLREETDPERRRTFALMNTQAKRVYEMIADMMLFARPPKPKFEPVELIGLIDHVVDDLRPGMAEQAVSLARVGGDGPIAIEADPTQLNVALRALCRNALEAIGHDGRIEIDAAESGDHAILRVIDNGPGIPPETRRHLFDPYFSARQAGRGLGMGLSKCWRIVVTNHHGSIDVASSPGSETVFTVTLPKTP
ncbi:MAG: HAMP domain-containing histidine kinase [Pirellulaceae bacterium]|nr:HAMP domain-containing histidine kinase [Pirellulaceae bacterium]